MWKYHMTPPVWKSIQNRYVCTSAAVLCVCAMRISGCFVRVRLRWGSCVGLALTRTPLWRLPPAPIWPHSLALSGVQTPSPPDYVVLCHVPLPSDLTVACQPNSLKVLEWHLLYQTPQERHT